MLHRHFCPQTQVLPSCTHIKQHWAVALRSSHNLKVAMLSQHPAPHCSVLGMLIPRNAWESLPGFWELRSLQRSLGILLFTDLCGICDFYWKCQIADENDWTVSVLTLLPGNSIKNIYLVMNHSLFVVTVWMQNLQGTLLDAAKPRANSDAELPLYLLYSNVSVHFPIISILSLSADDLETVQCLFRGSLSFSQEGFWILYLFWMCKLLSWKFCTRVVTILNPCSCIH